MFLSTRLEHLYIYVLCIYMSLLTELDEMFPLEGPNLSGSKTSGPEGQEVMRGL